MMKTLTRVFLSLAATFCLFAQNASAQNIPDLKFASAIRADCPACIDVNNNLLPPAQDLDNLHIVGRGIFDLTGIEGFINLTYLNCANNHLNFLPALPDRLTYLNCSENNLSYLPILPDSLNYLNCFLNQLTSLPFLPDNLNYLNCGINQLDSLPPLPGSLTILNCFVNQLISLSALPNGLKDLECFNNQLTSLPLLPDSLTRLDCRYNPSLFCLPFLPNGLGYLRTSGTQITCIPNQPDDLDMSPLLPLCSEPCDSSVSTSNIYTAKPFTVQPNPVSDVLQVHFSADYEAKTDFRLLNSNGQIVRAISAKGDMEIPVGDLPEGIYWLEVRGARWIFGEKILKK